MNKFPNASNSCKALNVVMNVGSVPVSRLKAKPRPVREVKADHCGGTVPACMQAPTHASVKVDPRRRRAACMCTPAGRKSRGGSHTYHGHETGTRSMQPVRSVPLGGPIVS